MSWETTWELFAIGAAIHLALLGNFVVSGLAIRYLYRLQSPSRLDRVLLWALDCRLLLNLVLTAAHYLLPGELPDPGRLGGMTMERLLLYLSPVSVLLNSVIIFAAWRHRRNMSREGPVLLVMLVSCFSWLELAFGLLTIFMPLFIFGLLLYLLYQVIDR